MWHWRRIVYPGHFAGGIVPHERTLVVWFQNDYFVKNIIDKPDDAVEEALEEARQLTLSFLYWMQTESPRPDGGVVTRACTYVQTPWAPTTAWPSTHIYESRAVSKPYSRLPRIISAWTHGLALPVPSRFTTPSDWGAITSTCMPVPVVTTSSIWTRGLSRFRWGPHTRPSGKSPAGRQEHRDDPTSATAPSVCILWSGTSRVGWAPRGVLSGQGPPTSSRPRRRDAVERVPVAVCRSGNRAGVAGSRA